MALKFGTNTIPDSGNNAKFGTNNLTNVKFASSTVWTKQSKTKIDLGYFQVSFSIEDDIDLCVTFTIDSAYLANGAGIIPVITYDLETSTEIYGDDSVEYGPYTTSGQKSITIFHSDTGALINACHAEIYFKSTDENAWEESNYEYFDY